MCGVCVKALFLLLVLSGGKVTPFYCKKGKKQRNCGELSINIANFVVIRTINY